MMRGLYTAADRVRLVLDVVDGPRQRDPLLGGPVTAAADVDDVAVQRCIDGSYPTPRLNAAERAEAVRRMEKAGASISVTAARLGISERHVAHLRRQARA